jgi:hypothetical protein
MVASHTTKKRRKEAAVRQAQFQVVEELFATYLTVWSQQEIQRLVSTGTLLVLPANGGLRVGHFLIRKQADVWEVNSERNDHALNFSSKISAVFYCLYECRRQFQKSNELYLQDTMVQKLDHDSRLYRHKYKRACENKNFFAKDLWEARTSDVVPRLEAAQEELQKIINSAKYIKIWD